MLIALAHAAALEKDGGGKGSSEAVAGRLERAAQIVKQARGQRARALLVGNVASAACARRCSVLQ